MDGRTLFGSPTGVNPRQYDLNNLNCLVAAFEQVTINPAQIGIYPEALKAVVDAIPGKLVGIEKPGPFKKAAALTLALVENQVFYYLLNDIGQEPAMAGWDQQLKVFAAIGIARLYLTTTLPAWRRIEKKDFKPPSFVSAHFIRDLRALILIRHETVDLRMLALIWELMTYLSNTHIQIHGPPETNIDLPGVSI